MPQHIRAEWPAILIAELLFAGVTLAILNTVGVFFTRGPKWFISKPIRGRKDLVWRIGGLVFLLVSLSIGGFPYTVVYHKAINPTPIPAISLPDPNGYDDLVRVDETLRGMGMPDPNTATSEELADFVRGHPEVYEAIQLGLSRESLMPLAYTNANLSTLLSEDFRDVADALRLEGRLAEAEGRVPYAVASYLDILRLAEVSRRGGLSTDVFSGNVLEWLAVDRLDSDRGHLPRQRGGAND